MLGRIIYPSLLWSLPTPQKILYLSFDDGPVPQVTPWVLSLLKEYGAKATFFCIGENVKKHPILYQQILAEGHRTGNHTFHHVNGWETSTNAYIKNVQLAEEVLNNTITQDGKTPIPDAEPSIQPVAGQCPSSEDPLAALSNPTPLRQKLFRPPYGKITPGQIKAVKNLGYKIVMWNSLSGDFDQRLQPEDCYKNVALYANKGSIVVFHDSIKASINLKYALPKVLAHYKEKGFEFRTI